MLDSPQNEIIEKLLQKLSKGFGRHVFIGENTFQDPVVNAVYQAFRTLRENRNDQNLTVLEDKLSACETAGKRWFPYAEIREVLAEMRGTFEQSNGAGNRKTKP